MPLGGEFESTEHEKEKKVCTLTLICYFQSQALLLSGNAHLCNCLASSYIVSTQCMLIDLGHHRNYTEHLKHQ